MNSIRIVGPDNDSIFVTKNEDDDVWLAVIHDFNGHSVEVKLNAQAVGELRDALTEVE